MRILVLILAIAVLGGCASTESTPAPPATAGSVSLPTIEPVAATAGETPEPAPTETPEPAASSQPAASPVAMSMEEAAAAYLRIAGVYNRKAKAIWKRYKGDDVTLKQRQKEWLAYAAIDKKFADDLKALTWPDEVAADIRTLVRMTVIDESNDRQAARAAGRNWDALYEAAADANKHVKKSRNQASIVRDILGLPSN